MIFLAVGSTMPVNFTSPTPSARPLPRPPSQPRKKPTICHIASRPRQPGITGSSWKWHLKNQRSGLMSSSATISPLPALPPFSRDRGDAIEHQHRRQRQLRIAGAEQFSPGAGQKACHVETGFAGRVTGVHVFGPFAGAPLTERGQHADFYVRSILTIVRLVCRISKDEARVSAAQGGSSSRSDT